MRTEIITSKESGKVTNIELSDSTVDNLNLLGKFSLHRSTFEEIISTLDLNPLMGDSKLASFDDSSTTAGGVPLVGMADEPEQVPSAGSPEAKLTAAKVRDVS